MSVDLDKMKRRSAAMLGLSLFAGLCAAAGVIGYFKFHQSWGLAAFAVAAIVGFGSQFWFIAGLRGPKSSSMGKGA
jgi:hypothetical protein